MVAENETTKKSSSFAQTLEIVESFLCAYYDIKSSIKAKDHILKGAQSSAYLQSLKAEGSTSSLVDLPRAAVWLAEEQTQEQIDAEIFLGIYFADDVKDMIADTRPLTELHVKNLDSFCVLVEELSHFHLICQRAEQERSVSQLELEWQGEIDKFLVSALLLTKQKKNPHFEGLQRMLFESVIYCMNDVRYVEANRRAAQFWRQAISSGVGTKISLMSLNFRRFMCTNYQKPLHEKLVFSGLGKVFV